MEYMFSERGNKLVKYCGFKYYKSRETAKVWKWRCTEKVCKAKLYLSDDEKTILDSDLCHNHDPTGNLCRQQISNRVKRKAADELVDKPSKIIRKEISSVPVDMSQNINRGDMELIRQNLYRARRKLIPPLPKNIIEVHLALSSCNLMTNRSENMLQINDESKNIIFFATDSSLKILSEYTEIFVDGTFYSCPKFFHQVFIIHVVENGHYSPLVFFLLPDKTASSYELSFKMLKEQCGKKGFSFKPKTIVADFEIAIHNAAMCVWPQIKILGCRFHLTQAWYRRIQHCGLSILYRDSKSELGQWLRLFFALPFLDPDEVSDAFVENIMSEQPDDLRIKAFTDYVTDNYISEEALFPPILWASPTAESERTTNACESFHHRLKNQLPSSHPNIYAFIEALKNIHIDIYAWKNTLSVKRRITNKKYKKRKEIVIELLKKYKDKKIARDYFLKCVAYHYYYK